MIETLNIKTRDVGNGIGYYEFIAQQHYNNTGQKKRVITAIPVEDGIAVEYETDGPKDIIENVVSEEPIKVETPVEVLMPVCDEPKPKPKKKRAKRGKA
jgi:hypothetical protein